MEDNLTRARARKAAMNWADWQAPKEADGDTIRGARVEAFEAGAAWAAQEAMVPETEAELNEIVASLVRDAQQTRGDDAADHAAKRIAAYFAGVQGAEQDLWAIERAQGQRQLDEAGALIREAAALLRGYEASHLGKADRISASGGRDLETEAAVDDARSKARRNGAMAARLEAWLAGEPLPGSMAAADQAAQEAFVNRDKPLIVPPAPQHHRAPADLVAAMAGATLIEQSDGVGQVGWVKVHGLRNARALFDCLAAANAVAQGGAVWRLEGVADLAAFRLTTGDPRFDPRKPATINGFLYHPTKED